jgi:NAD(P)-dependent dehydrogenase (short-subunit alcohol dehydrogenase family)
LDVVRAFREADSDDDVQSQSPSRALDADSAPDATSRRPRTLRPGQILTPGATQGTINDADGGHHVFEDMFNFAQIVQGPGLQQDVANLVLFLSSDDSRFISGEIINVDGGVAAKI